MYGLLWRALPGPWLLRAIVMAMLAAGVVAMCFQWLFPWVSTLLPINDANVHDPSSP